MSDKASLRKEILAKRDGIAPEVKKNKDSAIQERLFSIDEINAARTLFFFASFRSEVDTFGMIRKTLEERKKVVLPRVEGMDLGLYEIRGLEELVPGSMGILEPSVLTGERKVGIDDVDAVIAPGAAFDEAGNRIGYGGGYYDRLLSTMRKDIPVIAICYEEQMVDAVPAEPHDIRVVSIITDIRVVRIADRAKEIPCNHTTEDSAL